MQALLLLNLIVPFVMVLVGSLLKKHPVSDRSSQNGYNTSTARKSQEHWDYAQQIAPDIFIMMGKYLFATEITVSILMLLLPFSVLYAVIIGTGIGLAWLGYGFYVTDKQIKQRFEED